MTTQSTAPSPADNGDATAAAAAETSTEVVVDDELQTPEEGASEVAEPGEGTPEGEAEEDKVQAAIDAATRKARRRIDRLIAERAQRDERLARLEAELAEAKAPKDDDGKPKPEPTEDPRKIAQEMRIVEKTAEATERVWKEAVKKFPDFEAKVKDLVEETGSLIDPKGRPLPLMAAVLESDMAADVLNHLGANPEVAADLMGLSEIKLGRRIAQIENDLKAAAKPKTSAAAKPLTPVKAAAAPPVDPTKLTDKQWWQQRQKAKSA